MLLLKTTSQFCTGAKSGYSDFRFLLCERESDQSQLPCHCPGLREWAAQLILMGEPHRFYGLLEGPGHLEDAREALVSVGNNCLIRQIRGHIF